MSSSREAAACLDVDMMIEDETGEMVSKPQQPPATSSADIVTSSADSFQLDASGEDFVKAAYKTKYDLMREADHFEMAEKLLAAIETLKFDQFVAEEFETSLLLSPSRSVTTGGGGGSRSSSLSSLLTVASSGPASVQENSADVICKRLCDYIAHTHQQLPSIEEYLITDNDCPDQSLLPPPSSRAAQPSTHPVLRGDHSWAPPRPQIIFKVPESFKLKPLAQAEAQGFRCAGCGSRFERRSVSKMQLCHYIGKLFCPGFCHSKKTRVIPFRVLSTWDFRLYSVSNFSATVLDRELDRFLYDISVINPDLYKRRKILCECRDLRRQLFHINSYIVKCRKADEIGLRALLEQLPRYWCYDQHTYNMRDLIRLREDKKFLKEIQALVKRCRTHITLECELCRGRGFVCELCNIENDVIFPFDITGVVVCGLCQAAYHKKCFSKQAATCRKCSRIQRRQQQSNDDLTSPPPLEENATC